MGLLVEGRWVDKWYDTSASGGAFARSAARFRNWVTPDGSPGPSGTGGFRAEPQRYHLYVSHACPWCHRATIYYALKGLKSIVGLSVVHWLMRENGWTFTDGRGVVPDTVNHTRAMHEIYHKLHG
jgi:glutathionyl-hydroquinone reductase